MEPHKTRQQESLLPFFFCKSRQPGATRLACREGHRGPPTHHQIKNRNKTRGVATQPLPVLLHQPSACGDTQPTKLATPALQELIPGRCFSQGSLQHPFRPGQETHLICIAHFVDGVLLSEVFRRVDPTEQKQIHMSGYSAAPPRVTSAARLIRDFPCHKTRRSSSSE